MSWKRATVLLELRHSLPMKRRQLLLSIAGVLAGLRRVEKSFPRGDVGVAGVRVEQCRRTIEIALAGTMKGDGLNNGESLGAPVLEDSVPSRRGRAFGTGSRRYRP